MANPQLDLNLLATHLKARMEELELSARAAAPLLGCSPATLSRMLMGSDSPNEPDTRSLIQAASWLNKSLSDFEVGKRPEASSIADVEVHLRALPDLSAESKDALIAMVKAAHDAARFGGGKAK